MADNSKSVENARNLTSETQKQAQLQGTVNNGITDQVDLSTKLLENEKEITEQVEKQTEFRDKTKDIVKDETGLSKQLLDIRKKLRPLQFQEQKIARDLSLILESEIDQSEKLKAIQAAQVDYTKTQLELGNKLDKTFLSQLQKFEKMADTADKVTKSKTKAQQAMDQIKDDVKAQLEGINEIATALAKGGPYAAAAVAAGLLLKYVIDTAKATYDLMKAQGMTVGQSAELVANARIAQAENVLYGATLDDSTEAALALNKQAGDLSNATAEATSNAVKLSVGMGLGADTAATLQKVMKDVSDGTLEGSESMQDFVTDLAVANNIAPAAVMSDIAADTESFATFGKEGAVSFIKASIAAKKLGIEMSSITAAAGSLLNLEDSISKQMEAEVLIGRQLNLEAARQAAYQGDYLTLTKELTSQVGTLEDFTSMSTLKQQALADAVGLSVEDTRKMITNQDKIAGLSEEALEHYKETGEIQDKSVKTTIAENAEMIKAGAAAASMIASLAMQFSIRKAILGTSIAQSKVDGGGKGGGKTGGMTKMFSKINPMTLLKGAAAMVIMGAALFVAAKGFQELAAVDWGALWPGAVIALVALAGAMALFGVPTVAAFLLTGALVFAAMSVSLLLFGVALNVVAAALPKMVAPLSQLAEIGGSALAKIGIGFVAMGVGLTSMAAGLALITPMLPTLLAVGSMAALALPMINGGGTSPDKSGESSSTMDTVIEKLDELITTVKAGGTINLDGRKVGDVLTLAKAPIGV